MSTGAVRRVLAAALVAGLVLSIAVLAWYGDRAVRGWRRSAAQLAQRRAREAANLLRTALDRDMRGVQSVILSSARVEELHVDFPFGIRAVAASAFARYPYPESFFAWRGAPSADEVVFFDRAERRPAWAGPGQGPERFPVVVARYPSVARALIAGVQEDARRGRRFSTFETRQGGVPYQVVARLLYRDALSETPEAVLGFTVNLDWARRSYFGEVTREVARIADVGPGLLLSVVDDGGGRLAAVPDVPARGPAVRRPFFPRFYDPLSVGPEPSGAKAWSVEVAVGDDPELESAERGGRRTLLVVDVAAGALALGVLLAYRAARASERLAELRSEFVSTVTHELKTPIASIRAMGDTLTRGRLPDPAARLEYAQAIVQEAKRLARLVDNLLAYSRITDVTEVYTFRPVDLSSVTEEVLQGFSARLSQEGFQVDVSIPRDLPRVRADRDALRLVLENVVDNAIRYSGSSRWIGLTAAAGEGRCAVEVRDRGIGIAAEDVGMVTQRFRRGRNAVSGGSGLGLAIVSRVVADHGGKLAIESAPGEGTTVRVVLAAAGEEREATDTARRG